MQRSDKNPGINLLKNIQRNHALEHASIHILNRRFPHHRFMGRSDSNGFFLVTKLPLEETSEGILTALERLQAGNSRLAVHPNCGTNLMTGAFLAALSGMLIFNSRRSENEDFDPVNRFPLAILASMASMIVARPLGNLLQKEFTTNTDLDETSIRSITARPYGRFVLYRVLTQHV